MKTTISIENILLTGTELAVNWSDETESFITLKKLRDCCPCAFVLGKRMFWGMCIKGLNENWVKQRMKLQTMKE